MEELKSEKNIDKKQEFQNLLSDFKKKRLGLQHGQEQKHLEVFAKIHLCWKKGSLRLFKGETLAACDVGSHRFLALGESKRSRVCKETNNPGLWLPPQEKLS